MMTDEMKKELLYTTGEIAKLCGVTVRTVQYYDSRGILVPSLLSEGGRRLYTEEDVKRLKAICFLRELDLPLDSIKQLLFEKQPETVISLLLEQQESQLDKEIEERQQKRRNLEQLRRELKSVEHFSVESIGDIAHVVENRKKLRKARGMLFLIGIPLDIAQIVAVALWITKGIWWPFVCWLVIDLVLGGWAACHYMKKMAYICPRCHTQFKPGMKEALFAKHTPSTRKLTCTCCGYKGFCVETIGPSDTESALSALPSHKGP